MTVPAATTAILPDAVAACAGGGGAGTAGPFCQTPIPELTVTPQCLTNNGTWTWDKVVQNANTVWAGPVSGAPAKPVFRLLTATDLNPIAWLITGNSGIQPTNFIGTTDAADFIGKTNNVERFRVLSTGNTGIGTAAPQRLLDVGPAGLVITGGRGAIRGQIQDTGGVGINSGAVYNVRAWGALGDGTDQTTAIQNAVNQLTADWGTKVTRNWGATLYFPPGDYLLTAQIRVSGGAIPYPMNVVGAGRGVTIIRASMPVDTVGRVFEYSILSPAIGEPALPLNAYGLFHGPIIRDISFDAPSTNRPEAHVFVNIAGGSTKPILGTQIVSCEFNGAMFGLVLRETAVSVVRGCSFRPGNFTREILLQNDLFPDAGDSTIVECDFESRNMTGTQIQVENNGTNGQRIINNKFNGNITAVNSPGIHLQFGPNNLNVTGPQIMLIQGNSFENSVTRSIVFTGTNTNGTGRYIITGNQFDDFLGTGAASILFNQAVGAAQLVDIVITNNTFQRNFDDTNDRRMIEINPTGTTLRTYTIAHNIFETARATDTAVWTGATITGCHVGDNQYVGYTTPVTHTNATVNIHEGITLFGSGPFGNFIECWNGAKTAATMKFRVDYNGQSFVRFLNLGGRPPVDATTFASTLALDETNYVSTTNGFGFYAPRATGNFIGMRHDTTTFTGAFINMQGNTNAGGGSGTGSFQGDFINGFINGASKVFSINNQGALFMIKGILPSTVAAGGTLYITALGQLAYVGSSGTNTIVAPA